jgi:hypothetical protein
MNPKTFSSCKSGVALRLPPQSKIIRMPQGQRVAWRGARGWAMTEIKLGRTPHSAFQIPHLNGSFPEFILGWTIGAFGG